MRLPLFALTLACAAASIAATPYERDRGPGLTAEPRGDGLDYRAADFDAIAFGLPGSVEVRVGPSWSVHATGPADAFANVRVARRNNTLEISHRYQDGRRALPSEARLRFVVTAPRLASVALGGSGSMQVDRVQGQAFEAAVGGTGTLTLGPVTVERATFSIGGSGMIAAQGRVDRLVASIGGSGSLRAPDLHAAGARVAVAGSGRVQAAVDGQASVSTVGAAQVDLGPQARCSVSRMGHGTVRCG